MSENATEADELEADELDGVEAEYMGEDAEPDELDETQDKEKAPAEEKEPDKSSIDFKAEVERIARAGGWKPPDEYGEGGVDALPFVENGGKYVVQYRDTIKGLKKKLSLLEADREERKQRDAESQKVRAEEAKAELESMELRKDELIEEGDKAGVRAIEKEMETVKSKITPSPKAKESVTQDDQDQDESDQQEVDPEISKLVNDWADAHPLYKTDAEVARFANKKYDVYLDEGLEPETILGLIDDDIESRFKSRLPKETKKTKRPRSPVLSGGLPGGAKRKITIADLSPVHRKALRDTQAEMPGFTAKEYIDTLIESGEEL